MRKLLSAMMIGAALTFGVAGAPALATSPAPGGGSAFGEHVASMAPEHPLEHGGTAFGDCVSAMARGESCLHSH